MWCGGASDSEIYLRADLLHMGNIFDRIIRAIIEEVRGTFLFQIGYRIHVPSSPVSSGVRGGREQLFSPTSGALFEYEYRTRAIYFFNSKP